MCVLACACLPVSVCVFACVLAWFVCVCVPACVCAFVEAGKFQAGMKSPVVIDIYDPYKFPEREGDESGAFTANRPPPTQCPVDPFHEESIFGHDHALGSRKRLSRIFICVYTICLLLYCT